MATHLTNSTAKKNILAKNFSQTILPVRALTSSYLKMKLAIYT